MSRHRLGRMAAILETAAFATAACAYLLPFLAPDPPYRYEALDGLNIFLGGFAALVLAPWPWGLIWFVAASSPLSAALIGLMYRRRRRWQEALVGVACAMAGLAGTAGAYAIDRSDPLAVGFYMAGAAFVVAACAAGYRLAMAVRLRKVGGYEPVVPPDETALSASQELLQRFRGDW